MWSLPPWGRQDFVLQGRNIYIFVLSTDLQITEREFRHSRRCPCLTSNSDYVGSRPRQSHLKSSSVTMLLDVTSSFWAATNVSVEPSFLQPQCRSLLVYPENGTSTLFQNVLMYKTTRRHIKGNYSFHSMTAWWPAVAQAVCLWSLTVEAWVRSHASSCGICGGQCGTGTGFYPNTSVVLVTTVARLLHTYLSSTVYKLSNSQRC